VGKRDALRGVKKKTLAKLVSKFIKLLANSKFHSHLASWRVVISTPEIGLYPHTVLYIVQSHPKYNSPNSSIHTQIINLSINVFHRIPRPFILFPTLFCRQPEKSAISRSKQHLLSIKLHNNF
jgi:hypothetical protein